MDLTEKLELVSDRDTFLAFVHALIEDWKEKNSKSEWQNATIGTYLEAALAWAKDSQMGEKQGLSASESWKAFAIFLYAGKIYE